jgi:hypothetical protein
VTCRYCGVRFKQLRSCQAHVQRIHSDVAQPLAGWSSQSDQSGTVSAASRQEPLVSVTENDGSPLTSSRISGPAAVQSSPLLAHVRPQVQMGEARDRKPDVSATWLASPLAKTNVVAPTRLLPVTLPSRSGSSIRVVRKEHLYSPALLDSAM